MPERQGIPAIGLGTFGLTGDMGLAAISSAIRLGYRHLDTAQSYDTEQNVGSAIAKSGMERSRFFVTTKITNANFGRIPESIDDSLAGMGLDHLDLVLIHWPAPQDAPPVRDYIGHLARARDNGRCRLIGVSNFNRRHIDQAVAELGPGQLTTNQVERHLFLQNHVLADHCAARGIAITAYLPLARGRLGNTPELDRIAQRHEALPSQIALAYLLALDTIVIPKSGHAERQASNLAASGIRLDAGEIAALRALDRGDRQINPAGIAPDWD